MQKHVCHDCGKEIGKGGKYMPYEANGVSFVKCESCHTVDPILRNFQEAEVYSRIVGYIRPIKQWNKAQVYAKTIALYANTLAGAAGQ